MTWIDTWLRAFVVWWHGEGAAHQKDFYRCHGCQRILSWRFIQSGGCPCQAIRMSPAPLTTGLMVRALCLPWTVTPWRVRMRALTILADQERRRATRRVRA